MSLIKIFFDTNVWVYAHDESAPVVFLQEKP
jgi:hypothetical protein